jgi:ubiquinone/menaquinone biosynthesis C-methylase UbiE
MRKLEEEPKTYDNKFTELTKGINLKVQDWIFNHLKESSSILEAGCGTGSLAKRMALKGYDVIAIDSNFNMINHAMQNYPTETDVKLTYQIGSILNFPLEDHSKDAIVSTFLLSELRPLEQQIFLRRVWKALKTDGRLYIAAEFIPSGFWKLIFKIKRWWYKKKLKRLRLKRTQVIKWFFNYLDPIGFKITSKESWKHGSIQVLELEKTDSDGKTEPGYFKPNRKTFNGINSQLRILRCLLTGQSDHVSIEPGVYESGTPHKDSPIIVTANYDYTYIKVMRDLKGIDAWVLCIDSDGINVWCAARGENFGNKQLLEAVNATGLQDYSKKKTIILPQLSAGGVAIPQLPKKKEEFSYNILYGPVWSKQLPEFLEKRPPKKPDHMKIAKFSLSHRARAGLSHTTFLLRRIFVYPVILLFILLLALNRINHLWWIGEFIISIVIINAIISYGFPLSKFTRCFIKKGLFFSGLNLVILGVLNWVLHGSLIYLIWNSIIYIWLSFFSTMSFSGFTMESNPSEIQSIYPLFTKINLVLMILSISSIGIGVLFSLI